MEIEKVKDAFHDSHLELCRFVGISLSMLKKILASAGSLKALEIFVISALKNVCF